MAIPINGSWNGRVALSFDAFTGFTPRAPFVGEFVGQGLAFTRFPLPPEVRHFTAIDWDTLLPYTVRIARQHPELLSQGLIGFGYSQGGILVARWTELAGGTSGQEMASRLLSAHRMTPAGRAQFVADMDWLGAKLRDIGFEGYCAGTPHWGMHFTTSWWTQPIHWIVNDINPHLVPSYEPDHLVKFSARHLSGQVIVTSPHHIPSGSLIQIAVGTGMLTVHGLSTQPGGHDLFISAAASFVPGVRTVKFEETHIGFPTSREAAQAVVGLIEHPEPV